MEGAVMWNSRKSEPNLFSSIEDVLHFIALRFVERQKSRPSTRVEGPMGSAVADRVQE